MFIDTHTLKSAEGITLVDVRTPAEFRSAHIPGAVNVPLDLLGKHTEEIGAALNGDVVLVCRSGARAETARQQLAAVGVPHLRVLKGGTQAWQEHGHPVVEGPQRWDLERQVRLAAGSIVVGGVLASTVVKPAKWIAAGIGAGLVYSAVTNSCAMAALLSKLPYNSGHAPSLADVRENLAVA